MYVKQNNVSYDNKSEKLEVLNDHAPIDIGGFGAPINEDLKKKNIFSEEEFISLLFAEIMGDKQFHEEHPLAIPPAIVQRNF